MTGIINLLDQPRTLDALARPTTATISYFLSGTTTLAPIYSDHALTSPLTNPISLSSGALFPLVFLNPEIEYRRKIVYGDGTIHDVDPINDSTLSNILADTINVEDYGPDGTQAGDSLAIKAALIAANGRPISFQAKRYYWDSSTISASTVKWLGGGMPSINTGKTALEGTGTIIQGSGVFTGTNVQMFDIGFDRGSTAFGTGNDALKISPATYDSGRLCILNNVVGLGRNIADTYHAILVEGYETVSMQNVVGAVNQYCFAIKSRNVNINGLRAINGQNLIILKSDGTSAGTGSMNNVNLTNMVGEGTAATNYGIRILAQNVSTNNININNVNLNGVDYAMLYEAGVGTALSEVNVNNLNAKAVRLYGIQTGGAGGQYTMNFNNISFIDLESRAAQFQGGIVNINNMYCSMKAGSTSQANNFFRVESSTANFNAIGLRLVENYGSGGTIPTLLLNLGRGLSSLSGFQGNISGNLPLYGFKTQDATGATTTLVPLFNLDTMYSSMKLTATANCTITAITTTLPSGTSLPEGYRITIVPTSAFTFTFQDNANIRTRGGNVVRNNNQCISFAWFGSSWHQTDNI